MTKSINAPGAQKFVSAASDSNVDLPSMFGHTGSKQPTNVVPLVAIPKNGSARRSQVNARTVAANDGAAATRIRIAGPMREWSDLIEVSSEAWQDSILHGDIDGQIEIAKFLKEASEACRQLRLKETAKQKAKLKDIEAVFEPQEAELKRYRDNFLKQLGNEVYQANDQNSGVELSFQPTSVDAKMIDLEAIRPFFTEADLMKAAQKYYTATGKTDLIGAEYIPWARV
jgi:hypothetical protein